jgi:hypothetical protein
VLKPIQSFLRPAALAGAAALFCTPAHASWLDTDFYCRVYGCVVAHDGFSFDVYDVFDFSTGRPVPSGGKLVRWRTNPVLGSGAVTPVITGTRTEGPQGAPLRDETALMGIDRNGDGTVDIRPQGDTSNGFIDASDTLNPFSLASTTDLVSNETSAQRSFYLTSRTPFIMTARVLPSSASGEFTPQRYANIGFTHQVTTTGTDDGMEFGSQARRGGGLYRTLGNANDLGDLIGAPTQILHVRQEIRQKDSASLPAQSVRFDYVYGFKNYDLSMGAGLLSYRIEFEFYMP